MSHDAINNNVRIPGFELIEKVGQGGMAVVWKARQISLDRVVAVKFLNPQSSCRPDDQDRLMAEAHAAAHLKHPGIVQVYDAGIANGISYFVMEFVAGYSVGDWLRRKKMLSPDDALVVIEYVAQALNYAWETAGIIHCDIKPDNIMVDLDGAIKVADLGLARSIERLKSDPGKNIEIMGTPGYISPEQSGGFMDLDCRTDIYSLGATLYHLTTGKRLFEKHSDTVAMDMHATGHVKDSILIRPDLPLGVAWLIDKMLVKERKHRYPDWDSVLADIEIVKNGDLPLRPYPPSGSSTVSRSDRRDRATHAWEHRQQAEQFRQAWFGRIRIIAFSLITLVLTILLWAQSARQRAHEPPSTDGDPVQQPLDIPHVTRPDAPDAESNDISARDLYRYVMDWKRDHPGQYDEAIRRFRQVSEDMRGTRYSMMAEDAIAELEAARHDAVEEAWHNLQSDTESMIAEKRFREAAEMVLEYDGPWRAELEEQLLNYASEVQRRGEAYESDRERALQLAEQRFNQIIDATVDILMTGSIEDALAHLAPYTDQVEPAHNRRRIIQVSEVLQSALDLDTEVLATFEPQIGKEISIAFDRGTATYHVRGVRGGKIRLEQRLEGGARVEFEYEIQDLATEEYLNRLGDPERHEIALITGWHAYRERDFAKASDCFEHTHPLLATRLKARARTAKREQFEDNARREFIDLLETLDIEARPPDYLALRRAVEALDRERLSINLQAWVARFRETYPETDFVTRLAPVLEILERVTGADAIGDRSEDERERVAMEGAIDEYDLEGVIQMLQNRNPELQRHEIRILRDSQNRAYGMAIASDALRNIGPLAPLRALRALEFRGGEIGDLSILSGLPELTELVVEQCVARDFHPLRRLPLRKLELPGSAFSDVDLLRGMPLEELNLNNTPVRDIRQLHGMALRRLELENTRVFALRELRGMPLEVLNVGDTQIRDISALRDMPLQVLNLAGTSVFQFSVLQGMTLRSLNLSSTQFRDMSLLAGMPLRNLDLSNTRVTDIGVLRDMPLRRLNLSHTGVRDLSPLRGSIIEALFINQCSRVQDLGFTEGMPLRILSISGSGVRDLDTLHAPDLTTLFMENTRIEDIKPLSNLPIRALYLRGAPVSDYAPLVDLPLRELTVDNPQTGAVRPYLRRIRTLRRVNGRLWPPTQ